MSKHRLLVLLPVLAGLALTGTAVARMMPGAGVRDAVYQTCRHNGVHFNKQGHPNCGLHKGWGNGDEQGSPGDGGTGDEPDAGHGHDGGPAHDERQDGGHRHAGGHGGSGESHGRSGSHGHHGGD
jgi:hypothetical protein